MRKIALTVEQFDFLSEAVLKAGGCLRFEAHGSSMHPILHDNDVITVRPADTGELIPGAIVLCRSARNRLVAHRIAENHERRTPDRSLLLIRGDANPQGEEFVSTDNVIGIISGVERGRKAFRVDRGPRHALGRIVAKHKDLIPWLMAPPKFLRRVAAGVLRGIQGQATYRKVLKRILAHKVKYVVRGKVSPERESVNIPDLALSQGLPLQILFTQFLSHSGLCYTISAIVGNREAGSVKIFDRFAGSQERSNWWLVDLRIWPLLRGAGIGEQLVRRATEAVLKEGVTRLSVLVNASNRPALSLYCKLGFQKAPEPFQTAVTSFLGGNEVFTVMTLTSESSHQVVP